MASIKNTVKGAAKQVAGKAREAWGSLTGRRAGTAAKDSTRKEAGQAPETGERSRGDLAP
jgi:uncharacterized protein YjbJ (UPF0337 family)